ncbi:Glutathione peroxidase [Streptococcus sp. ZB199]|nr:Glutathione peroxidase [Streptococcus sp. ZB199]
MIPMTSIYDFSLENQQGEKISLSHYQGKVLIVVNTATGCGLTRNTKDYKISTSATRKRGLKS